MLTYGKDTLEATNESALVGLDEELVAAVDEKIPEFRRVLEICG